MQIVKILLLITLPCFWAYAGDRPASTSTQGAGTDTPTGIDFDKPGSAFYTSQSNSARLTGERLGTGKYANDELRKVIDVELVEKNQDFLIGKAYLVRRTKPVEGKKDSYQLIFAVKNESENPACGIQFIHIALKNADNKTVYHPNPSDVDGLYTRFVFGGFNKPFFPPSTCLDPGEAGYIILLSSGTYSRSSRSYSSIDHVEIQKISLIGPDSWKKQNKNKAKIAAEDVLIPNGYVVDVLSKKYYRIGISVYNPGSRPLKIDRLRTHVLLLDDVGLPLYATPYLHHERIDEAGHLTDDFTVRPGATIQVQTPVLEYDGLASSIRPILNLDPYSD